MQKSELRKTIRQRKRHFSGHQLAEMSLSAIQALLGHPRMVQAQSVLMYYSLPDEVCTHQAVDELLEQGKRVFLPVVVDGENMQICEYRGPHDLRIGAYDIMEPVGKRCETVDSIDVVVVPGMAFTPDGRRLGRGKGYYDRFLSAHPSLYRIGICFPFQLESDIPTDDFDVKMNEVICVSDCR